MNTEHRPYDNTIVLFGVVRENPEIKGEGFAEITIDYNFDGMGDTITCQGSNGIAKRIIEKVKKGMFVQVEGVMVTVCNKDGVIGNRKIIVIKDIKIQGVI